MKVKSARKNEREKKPPSVKTFVVQTLRRASFRWPFRAQCVKNARKERGLYECNNCKGLFKNGEYHIDHIKPIIDPQKGWVSFDSFIEGLFCPLENLQLLCKNCSDAKTMVEDQMRTLYSEQRKKLDNKEK